MSDVMLRRPRAKLAPPATPAARPAPASDAAVLELCDQVLALEASVTARLDAVRDLPGNHPRYQAAHDAATPEIHRRDALFTALGYLPATTAEATRAKARVALAMIAGEDEDPHERLVAGVLRELLAEGDA